jgi:hypothetical protein
VAVAWSPDSKLLATGPIGIDPTIWDVQAGAGRMRLPTEANFPEMLSYKTRAIAAEEPAAPVE